MRIDDPNAKPGPTTDISMSSREPPARPRRRRRRRWRGIEVRRFGAPSTSEGGVLRIPIGGGYWILRK